MAEWIYDEEHVGRMVRYYFDELGIIDGTVVAYLPPELNSGIALWYVNWLREDMTPANITDDELFQGLQNFDAYNGQSEPIEDINIDEPSSNNTANKEDYEVLWEEGKDEEVEDNYYNNIDDEVFDGKEIEVIQDNMFEKEVPGHFGFVGPLGFTSAGETIIPGFQTLLFSYLNAMYMIIR